MKENCFYHIYNRGNNRENLFLEERNYQYFLQLYSHHSHHIFPIADTYAYCLMKNYIHRNPQKHGFIDNFRDYPYSSYHTICEQKRSRLEYQQVIEWFGDVQSFEKYHQQFDEKAIQHLVEEDF